jgi:hypothetical protein
MLGDVWCNREPKPFEGRSWQKQVTAKLKPVFVLWLPLCLLLKFVTRWEANGKSVWTFWCQYNVSTARSGMW